MLWIGSRRPSPPPRYPHAFFTRRIFVRVSTVVPFPGLEAEESRRELQQLRAGHVAPAQAESLPVVRDEHIAMENALRMIRIAAVNKHMACRGNPEAARIPADWLIRIVDRALGPIDPAPEPTPAEDAGSMRP